LSAHHLHDSVQSRLIVLHPEDKLQCPDNRKFDASLQQPYPPNAVVARILQLVAEGWCSQEVHKMTEAQQLHQVVLILSDEFQIRRVDFMRSKQISVVVVGGYFSNALSYLVNFAVDLVVADNLEDDAD